ncbi:MAG: hypothetical protein HY846_02305 [Nitrosomonadales bacterium]|nr:hypothetical protein [Nitrosomonadales bacterium]
MNTDIVISGDVTPNIYDGMRCSMADWRDCVLANVPPLGTPTTKASSSIPTALGSEKQSLSNGLMQEPEIRIPQNSLNVKSTSAVSCENQSLTRVLDQRPEVLLPQNVVAQIHSVNVIDSNAVPIQVWEGCVQSVNIEKGTMKALLHAKIGVIPEHVGEIDLQWVSDQDVDLIRPGAIFYLTLFKRVKRGGSIENSQAIQFRRRPSWSKSQVDKVNERANMFLSKIKSKPMAD